MPDLTIRDVPPTDLEALSARAARHGRTTEEEVRQLIHDAAAEQLLISRLENATRAIDAQRQSVERVVGPAAPATRRRYRSVDPTPRRTP
jgi:plasmid stability protein